MLFSIGTKVKFRYTGESGVIIAILDEQMLQVRLDSNSELEIPAFEEDLVRNTDAEPVSAGAKFIQHQTAKKVEAPPRREIKNQYIILKPKESLILLYSKGTAAQTRWRDIGGSRIPVGSGLAYMARKRGAVDAIADDGRGR